MARPASARTDRTSRRNFLSAAAAVTAGLFSVPPFGARAGAASKPTVDPVAGRIAGADRSVRLAHCSDIHLRPELDAARGLRAALEAAHDLNPRPDVILTGGDHVHDARGADEARARELYDLFIAVTRDVDIPMRYCIGNHDVFGWSGRSRIPETHALYGKAMFKERLGLERLSHAFDLGAWRVVVLDNIQPASDNAGQRSYRGGLDEATLAFADAELAAANAAGRPKLICTHIPIVSAAGLVSAGDTQAFDLPIPTSLITHQPRTMLELLEKHRVELILTGHLHQSERLHYQHTTHIGQVAVCGAWWRGPNRGTPEGFGVLDLHPDGSWDHTYATFPWQAVAG